MLCEFVQKVTTKFCELTMSVLQRRNSVFRFCSNYVDEKTSQINIAIHLNVVEHCELVAMNSCRRLGTVLAYSDMKTRSGIIMLGFVLHP